MPFESDVTTISITELANKAANKNNELPSNKLELKSSFAEAITLAKDAVETVQAVSSLIAETVGVIENIGASAYDVVNELITTFEDPTATQADSTQSGDNMVTSKSDPQKDCGGFKLISNTLNEVNRLTSDLSYRIEVQTPLLAKFNFTPKHMLSYAYSSMVNQLSNSERLVDEILTIANDIITLVDSRDPNAITERTVNTDTVISAIQAKVNVALSDMSSLYTTYNKSTTFNNGVWLDALKNLTEAKDALEDSLGSFVGSRGTLYGAPSLKIVDKSNYMRDKVCALERALSAVNTTAEAMHTINETSVSFPGQNNTGSIVDRIACHISSIATELENMKIAGAVTVNLTAYKLVQTLQGLIIFMTQATGLLRGLTDAQVTYKVNVPEQEATDQQYNDEKSFKEYCYSFITESLSLSVTNRGSARLKSLLTIITNLAPSVKAYSTLYGDYLDVDEDYEEVLEQSFAIIEGVSQAFNDPKMEEYMASGDILSAFGLLGYGLVGERFKFAAELVTDIRKKTKLEDAAEERKHQRMNETIDGVYTQETFDISLGTDKQAARQRLKDQWQTYSSILGVLAAASDKIVSTIRGAGANMNDYKAKMTKLVTNVSTERNNACGRFIK